MRSAIIDRHAVRRAREAAGFTQEHLAARLGLTRVAISLWEIGLTQPSAANFRKLCRVLRVHRGDLLAVDDDRVA